MSYLELILKVLIFCFMLLGTVSSAAQKHKAADGREYLIETDPIYNWYMAFHECAQRDSQLLIIDSAAKNKVIIDLLGKVVGKPRNLWLGGNDEFRTSRDYDRPFYWSATGQRFSFAYWTVNNPNNYETQEHCVHIWDKEPNFQWNDQVCTNRYGFICEVNHYLETYQKDLQNKCDAVKQMTSTVTQEFTKIRQQQLSDIDQQRNKINSLQENLEIELQQLKNATHIATQQVIDQQQAQIGQLSEKVFKQFSLLSVDLKNSTSGIASELAEKLNGSLSENLHNLIVINQRG